MRPIPDGFDQLALIQEEKSKLFSANKIQLS
jgi:hypothetical protein